MPPAAMASSEVVTMASVAAERLCWCARNSTSRLMVPGNLGAEPNPPHSGSKAAANPV